MENKKLIEEINRVHEVMGLITESARTTIVKSLIRGLDDLMGISAKNADVLAREFGDDGAKLLRELTSDASDARPVGEILDDLRKLTDKGAFEEAMTALRLSLDEVLDDAGVSVTQKLEKVRDGVEDLVNKGQKTDAAKYLDDEFEKVADFGDETLENIIKDEYVFKRVNGFDVDTYKISSDAAETTSTVAGKSVKADFSKTLASYFTTVKTYTARVSKDIDAYLTLKKEAANLPAGSTERLEKLKNANTHLERVEQTLGVLRRKDKKEVAALIEDLELRIKDLPKNSPEKTQLKELLKKAKDPNATIDDLWQYLPDAGYKPTEGRYTEMVALRKERIDALRKTFDWAPGVKYTGDMGRLEAFLRFATGDVFKTLFNALRNPKYFGRLITNDLVSRLISFPFWIGLTETIVDGVAYLSFQGKITDEWVEENPNMAWALSFAGADYKDWDNTWGGLDFGINLLNNWFEKYNITVPAYEVWSWFQEYGHAAGIQDYFFEQKNKIDTLINSEEFKALSDEEKARKLQEIVAESEGFITQKFSWLMDETPETIESQVNALITQVDAQLQNPLDVAMNTYNNVSEEKQLKFLENGFPKLRNTVGDYWKQLKTENGVWVFVRDNGDEYIMKKGKDLKNNPSEYPFVDESKRSNLEDDMWMALVDKGGNKYHPFNIGKQLNPQLNENMYSKGLSILLEQEGIDPDDPDVQVGGSSETGSSETGSSETGGGTTRATRAARANEQRKKEEYENRMLAMFEKFMVYDGESERNLIEGNKLTTRDKESIINDCFNALVSKYGGVMNIEEKVIDDTVVLNTVLYLINDKRMDPFKIMYKSPLELEAKLMESVGLEKILHEQGVGVNYNTIYINYINGSREDDIELIKGGKAEVTARNNYDKRLAQNPVENTSTPSPTPRPGMTTEPKEQRQLRPEEELKIDTPKMIKKQMKNEKS